MVDSEEKRKLIAHYREPLVDRWVVARSVAGLLIVTFIAVVGAIFAEPDEINNPSVRATPDGKESARNRTPQKRAHNRKTPKAARTPPKSARNGSRRVADPLAPRARIEA